MAPLADLILMLWYIRVCTQHTRFTLANVYVSVCLFTRARIIREYSSHNATMAATEIPCGNSYNRGSRFPHGKTKTNYTKGESRQTMNVAPTTRSDEVQGRSINGNRCI